MTKRPFIAAPFFFLRTTLGPIERYADVVYKEDWVQALIDLYASEPLLREAVLVASPSLYEALSGQLKDPKQTAFSLLNYLIRMTTRPTPFGLFSCVTYGDFKEDTRIDFQLEKVGKKARPDMEWVFALVQKIYQDQEVFPSLPVKMNPLVTVKGGRLYLEYIRHFDANDFIPKACSVQNTELIGNILYFAKDSIAIHDLWAKLKEVMPHLEMEKTFAVIRSILEQQFLLPTLLPSLLDLDSVDSFLSCLPKKLPMQDLSRSIDAYSQQDLGAGEGSLKLLQMDMKKWCPDKAPLHIDSFYESPKQSLSQKISQELEKAVSISWKFSTLLYPQNRLAGYQEKFIQKYGTGRTVPLMELLSETEGLGPHDAINTASLQPTKFSQEWQKWLSKEWQKCLFERKQEIAITEKTVEHLFTLAEEISPDPKLALNTFDVFCKIAAGSQRAIDEGDFSLCISEFDWQGGSALGRFAYLFNTSFQEKMQQYTNDEEQLDQDVYFVEASYWPSAVKNANVAIHSSQRRYRLDLGEKRREKDSIHLEDIYVGLSSERFFLTLKDGKREIVPSFGNFLNPAFAPIPFKFLREVKLSRDQLLYPFSWERWIKNGVFFPRLRFGKTVLSSAQWNFDAKQCTKLKTSQIIPFFIEWAERWNLPSQFFLAKGDRRLLLDRTSQACLEIIGQKIKLGESLQLLEVFDTPWLQSDKGHHFVEVVVPFLKNPIYASASRIPLKKPIAKEKERLFLGSEWLFMKFYLHSESADRFLVQYLRGLAHYLLSQSGGVEWFFMRYTDPEHHIRFRICFSSSSLARDALAILNEVLQDWMEKTVIKDVVFSPYERETERYGGKDLIKDAESVFFFDSQATISFLEGLLTKAISYEKVVFQATSVVYFLRDLGFADSSIIRFLNTLSIDRKELEGFREHRKALIELLSGNENILDSSLRKKSFQQFSAKLEKYPDDERYNIFSSLLHMHCNRLGCDAREEKRAYIYARQALSQMKHLASQDQKTLAPQNS